MEARLRVYRSRGVQPGQEMKQVLERCPALLFNGDPQKMDMTLEGIANFFSNQDVTCF